MADELDEDAMFDRLAKGLRAVREDADLVRSSGAQGMSAGLARTEAELRGLAAAIVSLRETTDKQHAVTLRLEAAAAQSDADLRGLRQTVEALSRRVLEQAEMLARPAVHKPPRRAAARIRIALVVLLLALGAGAAGWIASGRDPTLGALAHRVVLRLSELSGIDLASLVEPAQPVRTKSQATPNPDPALRPQAIAVPAASAAPAPTAVAAEDPPPPAPARTDALPAVAVAAVAAPSVAPLRPADTRTTFPSPPAETPAAAAAPTQTAAAPLPPPVTEAMAAAPPIAQSELGAPPAPALAQPSQAVRHLMLRATADAWVQVRQKGGRVLLSRTLKAGDTWPVPAEPDLILDAGNVEGLDLEVDGVPTRFTGSTGGVIHNVALDANLLRSGAVRPAH
jgi:hypothetical protein